MRFHAYASAITAVVILVVFLLPHPVDWAQWLCVIVGVIGSYVFFLNFARYVQEQSNLYARGEIERPW